MKIFSHRIVVYIFSILTALIFTVLMIEVLMSPPLADLLQLVYLLGLTSLGSAVLGFISHRMGWWRRLPKLSYALVLGYLLAAVLTLFNIWLTARLMFINQHDLALGSLLLVFAGGISIAFGYFLSNSITQALSDLVTGAESLSQGNLSIRVPISGKDEIAQLAQAFNQMAFRLEEAAKAERALDETRRNLVAWASHDLRTPLASLKAMMDALADGIVSDPETISRYIHQSQIEINRMSTLIDDLFELAKLDAGEVAFDFEMVDLSDLISDTLEGFAARSKQGGITLTGSVSLDIDLVYMAPDKISRVLNNILENAIRHTPDGGKIHIEAYKDNETILIEIKDSGDGISPSDLPHVFDRFYRGERSRARNSLRHGGAGLGLAIAKGLVEAHLGKIWVASKLNQGTTIRFSLPITDS